MTRQLTYSVVADGGTDRLLIPIIQWAIHRLDPYVDILEPRFRKRQGSVKKFLEATSIEEMLIFVHRDSENQSLEQLNAFVAFQKSLAERYPYRQLLEE